MFTNIGNVYRELGEYEIARKYYKNAFKIDTELYGVDNHSHVARDHDNIGSAHRRLGEYISALEYYNKSLEMRKAVYGAQTDHPDIAGSYNNIEIGRAHV